MKISFDLDAVIFNMKPLELVAFNMAGLSYKKPTFWGEYEKIVYDKLDELWGNDMLYTMPVLDKGIPGILNTLLSRPDLDLFFVTERKLKQPEKTFKQLQNSGIHCRFDQVYDRDGLKSDTLKVLKPDIHFDDSPLVVQGCLDKNIPVVMISNNSTLYNHYLRNRVEHYKNLRTALIKKGIYVPQKSCY